MKFVSTPQVLNLRLKFWQEFSDPGTDFLFEKIVPWTPGRPFASGFDRQRAVKSSYRCLRLPAATGQAYLVQAHDFFKPARANKFGDRCRPELGSRLAQTLIKVLLKSLGRGAGAARGSVTDGQRNVSDHPPIAFARGWKKSETQPSAQQAPSIF